MASSTDSVVNPKLPTWNGDWLSWQDYRLQVELEQDATSKDDLSRLAPKLVRNLTGKAWEAITDQIDRAKLKTETGVDYLLKFLEEKRGKQKVDLLGDSMSAYFQKGDMVRKENETWSDYEARHSQAVREINKSLKAVGATTDVPSEIWGWFMLHQFLRLEATEIATVKSTTKSYKLDSLNESMRQLWGGDSLVSRDQEEKKQKSSGRVFNNEPNADDQPIWLGTGEPEKEQDGDDQDVSEDEIAVLYDEACEALHEDPTNPEVLANFQEVRKLRYTDAHRALDRSRTARGFYPNAVKRTSFGFNSNQRPTGNRQEPFKGNCIRCGKYGHRARDCPQKINTSTKTDTPGKIGFVSFFMEEAQQTQSMTEESVLMLEEDLDHMYQDDMDAPAPIMVSSMKGDQDEDQTDEPAFVGAASSEVTRDKAIIDCGASESIVGTHMLQDYCDTLTDLGFDVGDEVKIDRQIRKSFVFGNNQSSSALGLATINAGLCGSEAAVEMHVVEGATPFLLSSRWLYEQEAVINFKTGHALFPKLSDKQIKLERAPTFHLLLPLTAFSGNKAATRDLFVDPQENDVSVQRLHEEVLHAKSEGSE